MRNIQTLAVVACLITAASALPSQAQKHFAQKHPRRAEVLGRDKNVNNKLNADKGQLSGHYNQLKQEDRSVRKQEQRDAAVNGGKITKGEQRQLNKEENHINRQIQKDHN